MATDKDIPTLLAYAEITRQIHLYCDRERALTNQLADMYAAGKASGGDAPIPEREKRAREYAREMLSDRGHLIPDIPPAGGTEEELYAKRDGVRMIIRVLESERAKAELVEAAQWGDKNLPTFRTLCRARIFAQIALDGAHKRLEEFLDGATPPQRDALPLGYSWWDVDEELIARAVDGGIATRAEITRAQRAALKGQADIAE